MKSLLFEPATREKVEKELQEMLNAHTDFLTDATSGSPRAAGDAIQSIIELNFAEILGELIGEYSSNFARRAMADLAFKDRDGNYYVVDVKTHREETVFNMPNLTSVERLARFYEDDTNFFAMLMVRYALVGNHINVNRVYFLPLEHLKWSCLTIGALGKGQIQIANSNRIEIDSTISRRQWMLQFCDVMIEFYPREIQKIQARLLDFRRVKEFWLSKPEV